MNHVSARGLLASTLLSGGACLLALALTGCPAPDTSSSKTGTAGGGVAGSSAEAPPVFSLAWSEYPSWSAFGVADAVGLIDGDAGKLGPVETKWNVDIELKEAEYDPCLTMYGSGKCDAVCITNMDILALSLGRPGVAVLPTSTSKGADALLAVGVDDVKQLKGKKVHGLEKSVSEYCFVRNLELLGEKESDYDFTMMDPGAAALAMQQKKSGYEAIVVWNPFVMETLNKVPEAKVLFDSSSIPGEIIDMVVVGQDSLDKPGGDRFAAAIADAFYQLNQRLADPKTGDETLVKLGEKFSNLGLEAMKTVVQQTVFYKDGGEGLALFLDEGLKEIMKKVVAFCRAHEMVDEEPKVGYGDKDAAQNTNLRFDATDMKMAQCGN